MGCLDHIRRPLKSHRKKHLALVSASLPGMKVQVSYGISSQPKAINSNKRLHRKNRFYENYLQQTAPAYIRWHGHADGNGFRVLAWSESGGRRNFRTCYRFNRFCRNQSLRHGLGRQTVLAKSSGVQGVNIVDSHH